MVCPNCGQTNVEDARFCKSCGAALSNAACCSHCGAILPENAAVCSCGAAVSQGGGEPIHGDLAGESKPEILQEQIENQAEPAEAFHAVASASFSKGAATAKTKKKGERKRRLWIPVVAVFAAIAAIAAALLIVNSEGYLYNRGMKQYEQQQYYSAYYTWLKIVDSPKRPQDESYYREVMRMMKQCYNAAPDAFGNLDRPENVFDIERRYLEGIYYSLSNVEYIKFGEKLYAYTPGLHVMVPLDSVQQVHSTDYSGTYTTSGGNIVRWSTSMVSTHLYAGNVDTILGVDEGYVYFAPEKNSETWNFTSLHRVSTDGANNESTVVYDKEFRTAVPFDGSIYFIENEKLYSISAGGGQAELVTSVVPLSYSSSPYEALTMDQLEITDIERKDDSLIVIARKGGLGGIFGRVVFEYYPWSESVRNICTHMVEYGWDGYYRLDGDKYYHFHDDESLYVSDGTFCEMVGGYSGDGGFSDTVIADGMLYRLEGLELIVCDLSSSSSNCKTYSLPSSLRTDDAWMLFKADEKVFLRMNGPGRIDFRIYTVSPQGEFWRVQ